MTDFRSVTDVLILGLTGIICVIGIFSDRFDDNFIQRLGMCILAMASWGRAWFVVEHGVGQEIYVWYHLGAFFFAFGTLWKFSVRAYFSERSNTWWKRHFPYGRRKDDADVSF